MSVLLLLWTCSAAAAAAAAAGAAPAPEVNRCSTNDHFGLLGLRVPSLRL